VIALFTDKDAKMVEQFYAQKEMFDSYTTQEMFNDMSIQSNEVIPAPPREVLDPNVRPESFEEEYQENYQEEADEEVVEEFTGTCGGPMTGGGSCGAPSW
jgi:hypothetical protein